MVHHGYVVRMWGIVRRSLVKRKQYPFHAKSFLHAQHFHYIQITIKNVKNMLHEAKKSLNTIQDDARDIRDVFYMNW